MLDITATKTAFDTALASISTLEELEAVRVTYVGRKQGLVTAAFEELKALTVEDKRTTGPALNELKQHIETSLTTIAETLAAKSEAIDWSMPATEQSGGHLHPMTLVTQELEDIFRGLGFHVVDSPEIESDWFNFSALNMPEDHPARDMQDTFYVDGQSENGDKLVMRTHTSPGQIRFMQMHKPPFAIIIPGRTFRNEATDATHEHTFTQMEGLVVGKNISYANMIWTLRHALQQFFGDDVQTKLLPSYFPFVEPGAEMAMSSPKFKGGKWVEVLGCGMVNQKVFEAAGYPAGEYQGFAFGLGITRFALMKYGIPDIRLLAENDMRFLRQF